MVFGFHESEDAHRQVQQSGDKHESHLSHELIAGAASFAGMKAWEDHQRKEGKTVNHSTAKSLLAGFAGAEADKLAETKGMDEADKVKAHHQAKKNAENMYDDHYVKGHGASEYNPQQHSQHESFNRW